MVDSIAKERIFSWEGDKINGIVIPITRYRSTYRSAEMKENVKNHRRNVDRFSMPRKAWRRALKLARGTMNEHHINSLLKRVNLNA